MTSSTKSKTVQEICRMERHSIVERHTVHQAIDGELNLRVVLPERAFSPRLIDVVNQNNVAVNNIDTKSIELVVY